MSWKCVVCDTYNNDSDNECYVCGHIQGKEDVTAAFSAEEKIMGTSFTDDSVDLDDSSSLDSGHSDPSGKDSTHASDEHEKSSKVRKILIASIAIALLLVALYCYGNSDNYDSYSEDTDWGYEYSDNMEVRYDDVTMYIPEDWEWHSFEEETCEGVEGYLAQDDKNVIWCQIVSFGDYDSMSEFCNTLQSLNIPADGDSIEIDNCQEAIKCPEYESVDGYTIQAYVVIHNGRGYWVGVGALPDYYDYDYMQNILYNCTFGQ